MSDGDRLVSVIIPTYNCGEFVCGAVENALAQTHSPIEVIVMDDGSTDDTRERLRAYGGRIKYIYQANRGSSAARNAAVAAAEGDAVALLDADDLCPPRRVERQLSLLSAHPNVGFVACQAAMMNLDGTLTGELYNHGCDFEGKADAVLEKDSALRRFLKVNAALPFFLTPTALIRKSVFEAIGGYDESVHVTEDIDLTLRLLEVCDMGFVNETLYFYRKGRAASVSSTRRKTCGPLIRVMEKFAQSPGASDPEVRRLANERLAGKHSLMAAYLIQEHDLAGAREHLAAAAHSHSSPVTWARLAAAKAGRFGRPFLSWMARRRLQ